MGDNLITFQEPKKWPTNKGFFWTSPPQDWFIDGMQTKLNLDGEGQP